MVFLRGLGYLPPVIPSDLESFPFNIPILHDFPGLNFETPITVLVGENGSGKSTILEALAAAVGLQTLGEFPIDEDPTLEHARKLGRQLRLIWNKQTVKGFFIRAEDYFAYLKSVEKERSSYREEIKKIQEEMKDRSRFAQIQAVAPTAYSLASIQRRFGDNADARSHGEGFMHIFRQRLEIPGLYVIDEAEAALSPIAQLALVSLIKESVRIGSQFLIATHSPILMACPDAMIYTCDTHPISQIQYDEIEHVKLFRDFLSEPENFIRRL
jgi:predicted ATPase